MGYSNRKKALRVNVSSEHKQYLVDIEPNYQNLYKNAQSNTVYISESGLNLLIIRSRKKGSIKILEWLAAEVFPSLRKYGRYEFSSELQKENHILKKQYNDLLLKNEKLLHNQKKDRYPKGGIIYVIRPIGVKEELYKIGKTYDMNKRKAVLNTSFPDNIEIIATVKVDNPHAIETCIKGVLHEYRYRDNREYYNCSIDKIMNAIEHCNQAKENVKYNKHISRPLHIDFYRILTFDSKIVELAESNRPTNNFATQMDLYGQY